MAELITAPDLDIRDEEQLAAEAIGRISGGLTVALIDSQIEARQKLRPMVEAGTLAPPICPELINANPSSPHTAIIEAQAWLAGQIARRINLIPLQNEIAFANLFKIGLREATPAETVLEFSVAPPPDVDVTVPAGTEVSTQDGSYVFETIEDLVIPFGEASGQVQARRTVAGETTLAPNVLTHQVDLIAWVDEVTNPEAVNSGSKDEAVEEALERARNYQQRSERIVSTRDLENAILEDALLGNAIVKAFPFVVAGDFSNSAPGHTTVVVMTKLGDPVSTEQRWAINTMLEQLVGNQFVYVLDPLYVNFNVAANVRLTSGATQTATLAAIETNLRAFYAASRENFGRPILRSEVIAVIEGTTGVDRIEAQQSGAILASPLVDVKLDPWQLPKVVTVTMTVV